YVSSITGSIIVILLHFIPQWQAAANKWAWQVPITAFVFVAGYRIAKAVFSLYSEQAGKVRELQQELRKQTAGEKHLAEEDAKVYLVPINTDLGTGTVTFDVSNKGQRVNPAHRIRIRSEAVPNIVFEYIDHLDMAEHKSIIPSTKTENVF